MTAFVLINSPLVGPLTWTPVAEELHKVGVQAVVATLPPPLETAPPYWEKHAEAVVASMESLPEGTPVILVGHSGADVLLPAVGERSTHAVAAYIFVDSDIPRNGSSRLDGFPPGAAQAFREAAAGGIIPTWTEEDLRVVIPDDGTRRALAADLRPTPLALYEEPLPVFAGWPDAPCGYLAFVGAVPYPYDRAARYARQAGWVYTEMRGRHFHMLVAPPAVTGALADIARQAGINANTL
jgi:hypothetical protein